MRQRARGARRAQRPAGRRAGASRSRRSSARIDGDRIAYRRVDVRDRPRGAGSPRSPWRRPTAPPPADAAGAQAQGAAFWPLALARELDDLILHLRINEEEIGLWVLRTTGSADLVEAYDRFLDAARRRLARARDPPLPAAHAQAARRDLALALRAHRAGLVLRRHAAGAGAGRRPLLHARRRAARATTAPPATVRLTAVNFGAYPMPNGLTRLASRFLGRARARRRPQGPHRPGPRRGGRRRGRAGHLHARRHRLGRRGAHRARGARGLLARRADRHGGLAALRRARDAGDARSSAGCRRGRTGSSSARTPSGDKGALQVYGTGQRAEFDRRRV